MAMTKVKNLQLWCKKMVEGYRDVNIVDMTTSWKDGLAFCALIHKFRPDLIDYDSLSKENVHENNQLAFEVAERELSIPAFLEADDMVAIRVPDRLSIITYVSQYYNTLHDKPQLGGPGVRKAITPGGGAARKPGEVSSPLVISQTLAASTPVQIERKETLGDKCIICKEKVYLLERHIENGKLYHRTCFRNSELSPTSKVFKRPSITSSEDKNNVQNKTRKIDDKQRKEENRTSDKEEPQLSYWERRAIAKSKDQVTDSKKSDPVPEGKVVDLTTAGKSNHLNDLKIKDQQNQRSKDRVTDSKKSDPLPEVKVVDLTTAGKSNPLNDLKIDASTKTKSSLPTTPTSNAKVLSKTEEVSFKTESGKGGKKSESLADKFNELSQRNLNSLQDSGNLGSKTKKDKEQMKNTPSRSILEDGKSKGTNHSKEEQKFQPVPKPRQNLNKDNQKLLDLETMDTSEPLVMGKSKSRPAHLSGLNQDKDSVSTVTAKKQFHDRPKTSPNHEVGLQLKSVSPSQSSMESPLESPPPLPSTAPPPLPATAPLDISPMSPFMSPIASPRGGKVSDLHSKKDEQKSSPISTNRTFQFSNERTPCPMEIDVNITIPESSDNVARLVIPSRPIQDSEKDKAVFGGLLKSLAGVRKNHEEEKIKDNSSKHELDRLKQNAEKLDTEKSSLISVHQSNVDVRDLKSEFPIKNKESSKSSDQLSQSSTQENQTKLEKRKGEGLKDTEKEKSKLKPPGAKLEFIPSKTDLSSDQNKSIDTKSSDSKANDKKTGKIHLENKDAIKNGDLKSKETTSNIGKTNQELLRTKETSGDLDKHKDVIKAKQTGKVISQEASDIPSWKVDLEKKRAERPKSADLLSQTNMTKKTEWQIEAEKRMTARKGGFIDPEKAGIDNNKSNSNDKKNDTNASNNKDKVTKKDHVAPPRPISLHGKGGYADKAGLDANESNNSNKNTSGNNDKVNKTEHVPPLRPLSPPKVGNTRGLAGLPKAIDQNKNAVTNTMVKTGHILNSDKPQPEIKKRILPQPPQEPQKETSPPRLKKISVNCKIFADESDESTSGVPPPKPPRSPAVSDQKKIPLPSRPPPPKKEPAKKKMTPDEIQRHLEEIDKKLTGLELRGRKLEDAIRNAKEEDEDKLMINWFEMVSEKNELVRTEADLVYESREMELEEEQKEIENRLRVLLSKPDEEKTKEEELEEKYLIDKKLDIINQRSNIVDSIDEDRIRYEEEDKDIAELLKQKDFSRNNWNKKQADRVPVKIK